MNKNLIALACISACITGAQAQTATQSSVAQPILSFYGRIDMSVQHVSRGDSAADANNTINGKTSGAIDTSIIGLRLKKALDSGDYVGGSAEGRLSACCFTMKRGSGFQNGLDGGFQVRLVDLVRTVG